MHLVGSELTMDIFCDPTEISRRYRWQIVDLRRLFVFHGLRCGEADDFAALVAALEENKALRVDLSAVLRMIYEQNHRRIPDAEMLTAIALASGGDGLLDRRVEVPALARSTALLRMFLAGVGALAEAAPGRPDAEPEQTRGERATRAEPEARLDEAAASSFAPSYDELELDRDMDAIPPSVPAAVTASSFAPLYDELELDGNVIPADMQAAATADAVREEAIGSIPREVVSRYPDPPAEMPAGAASGIEPEDRAIASRPLQAFVWDRTERIFLPVAPALSELVASPETHAESQGGTRDEGADLSADPYRTQDDFDAEQGGAPLSGDWRSMVRSKGAVLVVLALIGAGAGAYAIRERPGSRSAKAPGEQQAATTQQTSGAAGISGADVARSPEETGATAKDDAVVGNGVAETARGSRPMQPIPLAAGVRPQTPQPLHEARAKEEKTKPASRESSTLKLAKLKVSTMPATLARATPSKPGTPAMLHPAASRGAVAVASEVMQRQLLSSRQPVYPKAALADHRAGSVVLNAFIARDGTVKRIDVVRGPGVFLDSAIAAASWRRYRPYLVDGRPVEVQTQITLNYVAP